MTIQILETLHGVGQGLCLFIPQQLAAPMFSSNAVERLAALGWFAAVKWYQLQSSSQGGTVPVGGKGSEMKADIPSV